MDKAFEKQWDYMAESDYLLNDSTPLNPAQRQPSGGGGGADRGGGQRVTTSLKNKYCFQCGGLGHIKKGCSKPYDAEAVKIAKAKIASLKEK